MDRADLELFERSVRHAAEQRTGTDLDAALDDLGWAEALADDPRAAVSVLFEVQGELGATSGALDQVVRRALGWSGDDRHGVVLPATGGWAPAGSLEGGRLAIHGIASPAITGADRALVVAAQGEDVVVAVVPTASLGLRHAEGLDPSLGLVEVDATGLPVDGTVAIDATRWSDALAAARVAIAHELVGASRTMLRLAREHALERIQFGVPISSFQAVRHRLAETLVAVETAEAVLDAAWIDGSATTAAMAKSVAGRSARTTAKHCQQVLAGIGFTTEHPFQAYVRRVLVLDALLGGTVSLSEQLGRDILASRRLPPLLPL